MVWAIDKILITELKSKVVLRFLMKCPSILFVLYTVCPVYRLSSLLFVPIYPLSRIPCVPLLFVPLAFVRVEFHQNSLLNLQKKDVNNINGTGTNDIRTNGIRTNGIRTNSRGTNGIRDIGYIGTNSREDKR